MPSKNAIKKYVTNGYYHVYNRGVEKRKIFIDDEDYKVFLYYLKSYLLPPDHPTHKKLPFTFRYISLNFDLYKKINLFAYCLMPNHFHLFLKQLDHKAIIEFMKRLSNAYTKYFNKKYDRIGPLFQGRYKAVLISNENYFLHLSRYIHLNPLELKDVSKKNLINYSYSSYGDYCELKKTDWIHQSEILEYFQQKAEKKNKNNSYKDFVEKYQGNDKELLNNVLLD